MSINKKTWKHTGNKLIAFRATKEEEKQIEEGIELGGFKDRTEFLKAAVKMAISELKKK